MSAAAALELGMTLGPMSQFPILDDLTTHEGQIAHESKIQAARDAGELNTDTAMLARIAAAVRTFQLSGGTL